MRVLIVSLIAVALWSIDSLGAIRDGAFQGDMKLTLTPSFSKVNLAETQPTCTEPRSLELE